MSGFSEINGGIHEYESIEEYAARKTTPLAIAAEPRWIEIPREELRSRQNRLAALMSRLANRNKPILTEDESELLEGLWQMLVDLLD